MTDPIQEEDVMPPRVVRHYDDVVIVLDNPKGGRDERYNYDLYNADVEELRPTFAVTTKGFQFYAETSVVEDRSNPDGEPIFHGYVQRGHTYRPSYRITIKF